jgi:hypothetical protein
MEQYKVTGLSIVLEGECIRQQSKGWGFLMANVNLE